ncbi:MAG: hypothetical protein MJ218_01210 [Opitutales bacterium]|nr:hypothetical protein [Opitutales bacterium]
MTKRISLLLALSIALGIHTPCYGLYVMVRSGFGELKGDDWGKFSKGKLEDPNVIGVTNNRISRDNDCTSGKIPYSNHRNLSVALGGRFDVFNIGSLGLEIEILGAYVSVKKRAPFNDEWWDVNIPYRPDFYAIRCSYLRDEAGHPIWNRNYIMFYLKNQRIAGAQVNVYWEHYILDWLSAGIGGGIGGAYICTKFTTLDFWRIWTPNNLVTCTWLGDSRRKYVHSGSLLYNFSLFVRAEKFETLFEVGYRHIGLHQMFGAKCYGLEIPKLANFHSDQIYLGVGRTF